MNTEKIFHLRLGNPVYNTSYPISPADWSEYRVTEPLSFDNETEISFYIHIPFCKKICSFCEYTKMLCPDENKQYSYLRTLDKDVSAFIVAHPYIKLKGFDIGGGTPTSLSDSNLKYLVGIFKKAITRLDVSSDFEPSIEATFDTMSAHKAKLLADAGIKRISLGVQSTCGDVLTQNHRVSNSKEAMAATMQMLKEAGIAKINLDIMYGLKGQTAESLRHDAETLAFLNPEQITLYELRTNMIKEESHLSKQELFYFYSYLYNKLISMGYSARFGQNTFSKSPTDMGVSSYLRSRMLEGVAYKGFGISAQSMNNEGVAYNAGKSSENIKPLLSYQTFHEEFTYRLPPTELASKYIAIGAYSGSFSLKRLNSILRTDAREYYHEAIDFCKSQGFITIENDRVFITKKAFLNYGVIFSLFYKIQAEEKSTSTLLPL